MLRVGKGQISPFVCVSTRSDVVIHGTIIIYCFGALIFLGTQNYLMEGKGDVSSPCMMPKKRRSLG